MRQAGDGNGLIKRKTPTVGFVVFCASLTFIWSVLGFLSGRTLQASLYLLLSLLLDRIESRSMQKAMNYGPEAPDDVNFATLSTFCAASGVQYILHYDKVQHLTSWEVRG